MYQVEYSTDQARAEDPISDSKELILVWNQLLQKEGVRVCKR